MKTLREYLDQLDEIDRRGFLKGMGAAAVAGAAGGLSKNAKAQSMNYDDAARLAVQKAQEAIGKFFWVNVGGQRSRIMDFIAQNVNKAIMAYCMDTNGYQVMEVIDYATDKAFNAADQTKPSIEDRAGQKLAISTANVFMNTYDSVILQKFNEYRQRAPQQQKQQPQQQSAEIAPIFKPENANLNTALSIYYYAKESNQQIAGEMLKGITEYINATNQKDFVNTSFKEIKMLLDNMKSSNPEKYEDLKNKMFAYYKISLQKLKQMSDSAGPEFKESVAEEELEEASPDAVQRIEQLVRYK